MWLRNGVLNARPALADDAQLSISGPKAAIVGLLVQPDKAAALVESGALDTTGDTSVLATFAGVMDEFDPAFNLVTP